MVSEPVPAMAVPDTFSELTAVAVRVPPEMVPPLSEPPDTVPPLRVPPEILAVLIVEAVVTAPVASTLNLLVPLLRKSARLPVAEALVLFTNRSA
jgi:hypothetical protein